MKSKRKRYRLDDLLVEMPEGLPRDEAWETMGEVRDEEVDDAPPAAVLDKAERGDAGCGIGLAKVARYVEERRGGDW